MSRLLLLCSILLLTPFAFAQDWQRQSNWVADWKTGCRVWSTSPDPAYTISWSGACGNGLAQGKGILQWFENDKPADRYEGEYKDGMLNGRGVFIWKNGDRYVGDFRDNMRNGSGAYTWSNGNRYEGEYRNDNRNGKGAFKFANGTRYEGEFIDGKASRRGTLDLSDGSRYEGDFLEDKPNGNGTYARGDEKFRGTWTNGCYRQKNVAVTLGASSKECGSQ